jgi:dephospho-CoA kinase
MLKVGVTGGIGSGKSVVCSVFHTLGIPVFNADDTARFLMEHDEALIKSIRNLLGSDVYVNDKLDRAKISSIVFLEPEKLQKLNALVHPATISYARRWIDNQSSPYIIKEAAIFFETGSNKEMNVMIGVSAPKELRIERAVKRSNIAREKVLSIIAQQMNEEEKMRKCDYVIINDDRTPVLPQVTQIHEILLERVNKLKK